MDNTLKPDYYFWTGYNDNDKQDCFKWASRKAYLDMNRTLTFKEELKYKSDNSIIIADRYYLCEKVSSIIENEFHILPNHESFRTRHRNLCDKIIEVYDGKLVKRNNRTEKTNLTYGQAQKWINMTLKYLWLLDRLGFLSVQDSKIIKAFETEFDIPLDSIIIRYAAKSNINTGLSKVVKAKDFGISDWSTISEYEKYEEYQKALKNAIQDYPSPLMWELIHWIKASNILNNA